MAESPSSTWGHFASLVNSANNSSKENSPVSPYPGANTKRDHSSEINEDVRSRCLPIGLGFFLGSGEKKGTQHTNKTTQKRASGSDTDGSLVRLTDRNSSGLFRCGNSCIFSVYPIREQAIVP